MFNARKLRSDALIGSFKVNIVTVAVTITVPININNNNNGFTEDIPDL